MINIYKQKYKNYKKDHLLVPTEETYRKYVKYKKKYILSKMGGGGYTVTVNVIMDGVTETFSVIHDDYDDIKNKKIDPIFNGICDDPKNESDRKLREICAANENRTLRDIFDIKMDGNIVTLTKTVSAKKVNVEYNIDCMANPEFNNTIEIDMYPGMTEDDIKNMVVNDIIKMTRKNEIIKNMYNNSDIENRIEFLYATSEPTYDKINFKFNINIGANGIIANVYSSRPSAGKSVRLPTRGISFLGKLEGLGIFADHDIDDEFLVDLSNLKLSQKAKDLIMMEWEAHIEDPIINHVLDGFHQVFNAFANNVILKGEEYVFVNKYIEQIHKMIVNLMGIVSKGVFLIMHFYPDVFNIAALYMLILETKYWTNLGVNLNVFIEFLTNYIGAIMNVIRKIFALDTSYFKRQCVMEMQTESRKIILQFVSEIQQIDQKNPYFIKIMRLVH